MKQVGFYNGAMAELRTLQLPALDRALFFGDGAFGVTEIEGGGLRTIVKQKGSAGTADPLDQRSSVGWKAIKTAEILIPEYLIRLIQAVPHQSESDFIVPQHYQTITKHLKKLADENNVVVRYEELKTRIRASHDERKTKYNFFRPFRSESPLSEHIKALKAAHEEKKEK